MGKHHNKKEALTLLGFALLFQTIGSSAQAAAPIPVKIGFVEALAPRDTTSSERFQKDYELAIETGKQALKAKLKACGYEFTTERAFYDASDPLQAREKANALESSGAWLIAGPRRSNHYLLLAQGATRTSTVSLMASSEQIADLGAQHVSLSPLNSAMARAAAREAKQLISRKNRTYVSVVSSDCTNCLDFARAFAQEAKNLGFSESLKIEITGETPDLTPAAEAVRTLKPAFVLLPNYSKVSTQALAKLTFEGSQHFYVGGDGWGDANFGFVNQAEGIAQAKGFSVRGFPPFDVGLRRVPLGAKFDATQTTLPQSSPALGILKILSETKELLCREKPKNSAQFRKAFEKSSAQRFSAPWGVSIYQLKNARLSFLKSAGIKSGRK